MKLIEKIQNLIHKSGKLNPTHQHALPGDFHNPWPGLAAYKDPYGSINERLFCGRDKESFELTRMIDDNIFVTLYGKSGNGKTSLLNAGVFPKLRGMHYVPVSIRLGIEPDNRSFQESIVNAIRSTIKLDCIKEIWGDESIKPMQDRNSNEYLWNFFARHRFYADSKYKTQVFPVIVLDQFEEVYKSRKTEADKLLCQINYLMEEDHQLESFETDEGLYEYEQNFRFVISIREDDLYYLEDSIDNNFLQKMKMTRYRLLPITTQGARDVIIRPAEADNLFAENEKEKIVETIIGISKGNGDSISSNVLSLICSRIYVHYFEKQEGKGNISYELVNEFVSDKPLEKFYLESTAHLRRSQKNYLEDKLVNIAGRRGSVSKEDFDNLFRKRGESLLSGPLKILQENNGRVELIHDSFCRVLLDQKAKRMERWRTVVEHVGLMLMCLIIFIISKDVYEYQINEDPEGFIQDAGITLLEVIDLWWVLFLFFLVGVIHRSFANYFIKYGLAIILLPIIVDLVVMKQSNTHVSLRFYILSTILFIFTISAWWFTRKSQPKKAEDRLTFTALWGFRSVKIWIFIFFLTTLLNRMFNTSSSIFTTDWGYTISLTFLPSLFYGMFEGNERKGYDWGLIMFMLMPISSVVYFTSDVEFLKLNGGFFELILPTIFCLGPLGFILYAVFDISDNKIIGVMCVIICCALLFGFYALLYQYKFWMLAIWCLLFLLMSYWISDDKSSYNIIQSVSTFVFILFVYIFLKGYNPNINGVQSNQQTAHWRWKNVIAYNGTDYRLLDAISGEDLLGIGFAEHKNYEELLLSLPDSITYNFGGYLFKFDQENKKMTYYVYPEFEERINKNSSNGRIVSLTFKKNRQRMFDLISEKQRMTNTDVDIQKNQRILIQKEYEKVTEILNSNSDSIVKRDINRQLCKGVSCDILINSLGRSKSIKDNDFFIYSFGLMYFVDSYYYEDIHGYSNTDWDGVFENMVRWYIYYLSEVKISPRTQYLHHVIPDLIDYYNQTEDYGLKTLLYSKIIRLQQLAILYGLGKQPWSHYVIDSPVGVNIDTFYKQYQKHSRNR